MAEHTNEPWNGVEGTIEGSEAEWVADISMSPRGEANRRRIIACVNACAGITDEQLEPGGTAHGLLQKLAELHRLNALRSER